MAVVGEKSCLKGLGAGPGWLRGERAGSASARRGLWGLWQIKRSFLAASRQQGGGAQQHGQQDATPRAIHACS